MFTLNQWCPRRIERARQHCVASSTCREFSLGPVAAISFIVATGFTEVCKLVRGHQASGPIATISDIIRPDYLACKHLTISHSDLAEH